MTEPNTQDGVDESRQAELFPEEIPGVYFEEVILDALPPNPELVGPAPDPALIRSIDHWGILQPVVLRPGPDAQGGLPYVVMDGRRRIKASRHLERETVRAFVIETEDWYSAYNSLVMALGGTRSDNHAADLDAILELMDAGYNESDISHATGHSVETIRRRLRLTKLEPELMDLFRAGRMATGVAERAARLPAPAQRRLIEASEGKRITGPMVEEQRQARLASAAQNTPLDFMAGMPGSEDVPPGEMASLADDHYTAGINTPPDDYRDPSTEEPHPEMDPDYEAFVTQPDIDHDGFSPAPDEPDPVDAETEAQMDERLRADVQHLEERHAALVGLKSRERSKWSNRDLEAVANLLDSFDWPS